MKWGYTSTFKGENILEHTYWLCKKLLLVGLLEGKVEGEMVGQFVGKLLGLKVGRLVGL